MTDLITTRPRAPRRRPRHRQARRHPRARPGGRRRRPRRRRRPARRGRLRPRGHRPPPACPAASRSRTAAPTASRSPTLAFARLAPQVDFGAKDGPADLAFLIAAPAGGDATHLQLLTKLARALVKKDFTDGAPRRRPTPEEVADAGQRGRSAAAQPPRRARAGCRAARRRRPARRPGRSAVARSRVTACPTGIAHTYMAAEALEAAAERAGVDIAVETQGSAGSTPLARETIAAADAAIFAVDVGRPRPRPLRRQAARLLRRQAADRRRRRDDRRGAALRRRPERPARRGRSRRRCGAAAPRAAAAASPGARAPVGC